MIPPSQVDVFFPQQPFGGVLVEFPDALKLITLHTGLPGPQGEQGERGIPGQSGATLMASTGPLIVGQDFVDIVFPVAQASTDWLVLPMQVVNLVDANPLNLIPGLITQKLTTGCRVLLNGAPDTPNYFLQYGLIGGQPFVPPVATTYSFTGPASGDAGLPSTNFIVSLPGGSTVPVPVTITPDDAGDGGTFTPSSVVVSTGAPSATFTYTAASPGTKTLSVTNDGGLTDPAPLSYLASSAPHLLDSLISYWKFDEAASAPTCADNEGSLNLSFLVGAFNGGFAGKINTCGFYDGATTGCPLHSDNALLKPGGSFTFQFWLRPDDVANAIIAMIKGNFTLGGSWVEYQCGHDPTNGFYFGGFAETAKVGTPVAAFSMNHVLGWWDATAGKWGIRVNNGTVHLSAASSHTPNTGEFMIGSFMNGAGQYNGLGQWNGLIDETAFWGRLLTTDEQDALWNAGAALPRSSFTA